MRICTSGVHGTHYYVDPNLYTIYNPEVQQFSNRLADYIIVSYIMDCKVCDWEM
jgi:hypothetical protein